MVEKNVWITYQPQAYSTPMNELGIRAVIRKKKPITARKKRTSLLTII
ncbi:hypothetical protein CHCC20331_0583 [Bacillus paralicheniformis]|nr:hypothetical protein CHCC20331_0583 [Bacillus paralicheniformis]